MGPWHSLRSWWAMRKLTGVMKRLHQAQTDQEEKLAVLTIRSRELNALHERLDALHDRIQVDLDAVARSHRRYEETLNEARARLQVTEDILIPSLTEAHTVILERLRAETTLQVGRQVLQGPTAPEV